MIVSFHVASGAAGGAAVGSRLGALVLGPFLHILADMVPHHDIRSRRFEIWSGIAILIGVALARGPTHPAVIGALAASAPDVEHVFRLPRPGGRKLFPSHRVRGWHRIGGLSASTQLVAAGFLAGTVIAGRANRGGN